MHAWVSALHVFLKWAVRGGTKAEWESAFEKSDRRGMQPPGAECLQRSQRPAEPDVTLCCLLGTVKCSSAQLHSLKAENSFVIISVSALYDSLHHPGAGPRAPPPGSQRSVYWISGGHALRHTLPHCDRLSSGLAGAPSRARKYQDFIPPQVMRDADRLPCLCHPCMGRLPPELPQPLAGSATRRPPCAASILSADTAFCSCIAPGEKRWSALKTDTTREALHLWLQSRTTLLEIWRGGCHRIGA